MNIAEWKQQNYRMIWSIHLPSSFDEFEQSLDRRAKELRDQGLDRDSINATIDQEARADQFGYGRIELDLRAPANLPDGIYSIMVREPRGPHAAHGVEIRDGQFVPEPTQAACYRAQCRAEDMSPAEIAGPARCTDHIFIEKIRWIPAAGMLELIAGS